MGRRARLRAAVALTVAAIVLAPNARDARSQASSDGLTETRLVCTPSRLVLRRTDALTVQVHLLGGDRAAAGPPRQTWSVSGGTIIDAFPEATWRFHQVSPGEYVATLRMEGGSPGPMECAVRVFVEEPFTGPDPRREPRGELARETGMALLVSDPPTPLVSHPHLVSHPEEVAGFGLYTYVLLAAQPAAADRDRYLAFLEAFIAMAPDLAALERHVPPSELNVAYIPVTAAPSPTLDREKLAGFVLDHYDYPRARALLRLVPGVHRHGPYIVSAPAPLGSTARLEPPYVDQDMALFPTPFMRRMVTEFLIQAAQERFNEPRVLARLVLTMQVIASVLGEKALPDVGRAMKTWLRLSKPTGS